MIVLLAILLAFANGGGADMKVVRDTPDLAVITWGSAESGPAWASVAIEDGQLIIDVQYEEGE
jgi:hypothetical protein